MDNNKQIEALKEEEFKKIHAYGKLFATADGHTVLEDLRETFCNRSSIVPGDPYATHAREGAREVILFIDNMMAHNGDK